MAVSLQAKGIARWLSGALVQVSFASSAFGVGWIDSNVHWDSEIRPVSCSCLQQPADCVPCQPSMKSSDSNASPETSANQSPSTQQSTPENNQPENFAPNMGGGASSGSVAAIAGLPGYLDPAMIATRVRVRYDDYRGANEPTRAEMFYPAPARVGGPGPNGTTQGDVDFRQLSTYVEFALNPCVSVFGEFPVNWVDDVNNGGTSRTEGGFGDIKAGVRYGLIACPDEWMTAQVRVWAPSGDADRALGVGHTSIDAALLYEQRLNCNTSWWYELDDWQTIDAGSTNAASGDVSLEANVAEYGVGVGYDVWHSCCCCQPKTLTAVVEVVGWTVLDGKTTPLSGPTLVEDARGDTIVNGKYGLRYSWNCDQTVYVGYGNNWTDDRWYSSIFRLEYTHQF